MSGRTFVLLFGAVILSARPAPAAEKYVPTSEYEQRTVGGFNVYISPKLLAKNAREVDAGLRDLESEINRLSYFIPREHMDFFRTLQVWVETETDNDASHFFPSRAGLQLRGQNPDKALGIELKRSHLNYQGFGVMVHECAHAYHFIKLGEKFPDIEAAYRQAMERKLYDAVRDYRSSDANSKIRAYATNSAAEYFAELSRIYFLNNYHLPKDRDELAKHDPAGFELMQKVWGRLPTIPQEGAALKKNGIELLRRGNYQGAVDDLSRALERIPNDYMVWHERAAAFTFLKKDGEAIRDYSRSLRLNDAVPTAYRGRGSAYLRQGKLNEAVADFNRALQLKPDYLLAYRGRAAAYRELGRKDAAARDDEEVRRLEQGQAKTP